MKDFIRKRLHENLGYEPLEIKESESELKFNNGTFNKNGANTIYMDGNPIVDFDCQL